MLTGKIDTSGMLGHLVLFSDFQAGQSLQREHFTGTWDCVANAIMDT